MNILVFNGSPRASGNTSNLLTAFLNIAEYRGHTVRVARTTMSACMHCSRCAEQPCPLKDSFEKQGISIPDIDAIIIASPIHFFSLTPAALSFLTRLYPYQLQEKIFGLILSSGSDFEDSGVSVVIDQFRHIDNYCGSTTVYPYHRVTYDEIWGVSDLDIRGLRHLLDRIENVARSDVFEAEKVGK